MRRRSGPTNQPIASAAQPPRGGLPLRFFLIFAVSFLLGFFLLVTPEVKPAVLQFSRGLVNASASLINVCGGAAKVDGDQRTILRDPRRGLGVEMKDGCNGVNITILLWSAVLAFPASWVRRVQGLLIGSAAIQGINLVRFISLFYLLQYNRPLFDFAHEYLWESLIMLDAVVVFWLWAQRAVRARTASHVPA